MSDFSRLFPPTDDPNKYLDKLIEEYAKGQAEAKAANEARYAEINQGYRGAIRQSRRAQREDVKFLKGQRREGLQQNAQRFLELGSQNEQDLTDRGLTNSSALATLRIGTEGERRRAATDINNSANRAILATRQAGRATTNAFKSGLLNFKERREDAYPDMNNLQALATQYGAAKGAEREQLFARIQGALGSLGGQQGQYPGLMGGPQLFGAQQQGGGGGNIGSGIGGLLGSLVGLIPGVGPALMPFGSMIGSQIGGSLLSGKKGF